MKRLILSASALTLVLSSMTAAAWWANPFHGPYSGPYGPHDYGAPYAYAPPPSPQQLHAVAERQREAAIEMMEARRQAMESERGEGALPMPERPEFPDMPAMPTFPEIPNYGARPAMPEFTLDSDQHQAEIDAYHAALKQHAAERRAAMQALSEQRRAVAEQRRQEWLCSRQAMRPLPQAALARGCTPAGNKTETDGNAESSDQTADSAPATNQAS